MTKTPLTVSSFDEAIKSIKAELGDGQSLRLKPPYVVRMRPAYLSLILVQSALIQDPDFLTMTERDMVRYLMQASHGAVDPRSATEAAKLMVVARDKWVG